MASTDTGRTEETDPAVPAAAISWGRTATKKEQVAAVVQQPQQVHRREQVPQHPHRRSGRYFTGFIAGPGGGGGGKRYIRLRGGPGALFGAGGGGGDTAVRRGRNGVLVITYYVPSRGMKLLGKLKIYNGARLKINQAQ